jgi:hypothetical protein
MGKLLIEVKHENYRKLDYRKVEEQNILVCYKLY